MSIPVANSNGEINFMKASLRPLLNHELGR